ncbi:MAG: ribbon-helix-helix protein, CopG family [Candidatus Thermoplasmatota archaeon]|nr:ribbon-helix-helix protein, CopG family [Candidatus Thermoplasmatota archaeon]MBS3790564.1 ribbon-helix-helix protein, CopG family [Candidatus Thermoplasmatota archaeon]
MPQQKTKGNERVTVNLDPESLERLEKIESELRTSKSEVVRRALEYLEIVLEKDNLSPEDLDTILDLRMRPDNLLFDIGIFQAFLEEIDEPSENLKEELKEIGGEFYTSYCEKGIAEPMKCLSRLEKTNLYRLIIESENNFTIIPMIPDMAEYLKTFLEGYIENSNISAELKMDKHKIRLRVK